MSEERARSAAGRRAYLLFVGFIAATWAVLNVLSLPAYRGEWTATLSCPYTVPIAVVLPFSGQFLPEGLFAFVYRLLWPALAVLFWKFVTRDWRIRSGILAGLISVALVFVSITTVNAVENAAAYRVNLLQVLMGWASTAGTVAAGLAVFVLATSALSAWVYRILGHACRIHDEKGQAEGRS